MSCPVVRFLCTGVLLFSTAVVSAAQDVQGAEDPPAHISFVDGTAALERDGQPDASPANMPLLSGDRVRTENGRLEILFADGSTLHLDSGTVVDFQSDELIRLLEGRIRLSIPGPNTRVLYRIDAPAASITIDSPGEYRVAIRQAAGGSEVELAVLRGSAELVNDDGRTPLRAGQRASSRAHTAPSYAYAFNSASWDEFDRWSEMRRDQRFGISTQYLPSEVRPYAASFDRHGAWRYETSYGYVWYPTVSDGWRPYHNGRWATLRPYGWTWVGADPWDWPTHHYGRWGVSAGAWFWIPGRTWGAAWVSWAYAPGYVSWCPLGWNNRPVLQMLTINRRGYDPWRAWTAVPDHHFSRWAGGRGFNVGRVASRDFDVRTRGAFVGRDAGPDFRGYAVPRSSAPVRIAGTGSPRRGSSPVYTNLDTGVSRTAPGPSRTIVGPSRATVVPHGRMDERVDRPRAVTRGDVARDANIAGAPRGERDLRGSTQVIEGPSRAPAAGAQSPVMSGDRVPRPGVIGRGDGQATRSGHDTGAVAVPRDHPIYRPGPAPSYGGERSTPVTPEPTAPAPETARPHGFGTPTHEEAPGRRAPEGASDGGRAVPRSEPRTDRPGAGSHPGPASIDRRSAPPERSTGGSGEGSRSRSGGGRGR